MIASAPIRHFASIDSTNLEAQRQFQSGERGPLWIIADEQVGGRGRLGRSWHSPPGNLYSSLMLPLDLPVNAVAQIGFVVALAVRDVATHFTSSERVHLKWPNDCLLDGGKLAGILCETLSSRPLVVCIGCGINVSSSPAGLKYPTSRLQGYDVQEVLERYRFEFQKRLLQWQERGFSSIASDWQNFSIGKGEVVSLQDGQECHSGELIGLASDGALLLHIAGQKRQFYAGDLTIPSLEKLRRKLS